jgi:putative membrane protein
MNIKKQKLNKILDILALLGWGILFLKYSFTRQLYLLIHPNYFWLVTVTGIIFILISGYKSYELVREKNTNQKDNNGEHITLFPPGWSSILLITIAVLALLIPPKILASDTALQRGISESLPLTRIEPQSWVMKKNPEERSLLEWIRTLNAYPEPDAYIGQKAKVSGFVVHSLNLPENYFLIARFVLTCCAVDAYPVGIPVKIKEENRENYKQDTWLEIEGKMISETLTISDQNIDITPNTKTKRKLILEASNIDKIPTPANPYEY